MVITEIEFDCPEWAVCAIEYRDYSGLTDEDIRILENWEKSLCRENATWHIVFTDDRDEFNRYPEFGLPCATVRAMIVYHNYKPDETKGERHEIHD